MNLFKVEAEVQTWQPPTPEVWRRVAGSRQRRGSRKWREKQGHGPGASPWCAHFWAINYLHKVFAESERCARVCTLMGLTWCRVWTGWRKTQGKSEEEEPARATEICHGKESTAESVELRAAEIRVWVTDFQAGLHAVPGIARRWRCSASFIQVPPRSVFWGLLLRFILVFCLPCVCEFCVCTPVFWPGESHGLSSPRGRKESRTRQSDFHFHFPVLKQPVPAYLLCSFFQDAFLFFFFLWN